MTVSAFPNLQSNTLCLPILTTISNFDNQLRMSLCADLEKVSISSDNNGQTNDQNEFKNSESPISLLTNKIEGLYKFRDHFFETHRLDEAGDKHTLLTKEQQSVISKLEELKDEAQQEDRAKYLFLYGRALNVLPDYEPRAEEYLSKALKLKTSLIEAWNELGECFWKKGDSKQAKECFQGALAQSRNKISLRNLSIVLRREGATSRNPSDQIKLVEEALFMAKEAVAMDTSDGLSWSVLGNSHLAAFFNIAQNPVTLKQCMSAYHQAEKDPAAGSTADLHYNKGVALRYEEEFSGALKSLGLAQSLEPTWEEARSQEQDLLSWLSSVTELLQNKGRVRGKKLQQMLQSLAPRLLGPYQGEFKGIKLEQTMLSKLKPGLNTGLVVLGRVLCSVHAATQVPFTFCLMDAERTVVAVTVYNLAQGKGVIIGDAVAIPDPYYSSIDISHNNKSYKMNTIRVNSPLVMVVNGKKLGAGHQAGTLLSTFSKPD